MNRLISILALGLGLFLPQFVLAETPPPVGSYVDIPKWRAPVGSVYYYDVSSFCAASIAANFPGRTCGNAKIKSTDANKLAQHWSYDRMYNGTVEWSYVADAAAYCDPTFYNGPTTDPAVPGIYKCKVVVQPPPQCPANGGTKEWYPFTGLTGDSIASAIESVDKNGHRGFPTCASSGCVTQVDTVYSCIGNGTTTNCLIGGKTTGALCNAFSNDQSSAFGTGTSTTPTGSRVPLPPMPSNATSCPKGSVSGGMDSTGIPICIGTGVDSSNPKDPPKTTTGPTTTTTNADGSTTATQATTQQNSDGSTTTTTTTTVTGTDGSKTVTVNSNTTNSSGGTPGKMDTPSEPSDLCQQHPELSVCRNSSVSGSCGQIACAGDAIQCATLRAAAQMQCNQQSDIDALKARSEVASGNAILAGTDAMQGQITDLVKGTEVDMSKPNLDQAGFVGGGSCIPAKTFSVMGRSVTVDFTDVCSNIQPLRAVIMALAFIVSYLIVARSVLQS